MLFGRDPINEKDLDSLYNPKHNNQRTDHIVHRHKHTCLQFIFFLSFRHLFQTKTCMMATQNTGITTDLGPGQYQF